MKLNRNILKLQKAASTDTTRPNLTGIYLDQQNQRAIASTGHILAIQKIPKEQADELPRSAIYQFATKGKEPSQVVSFSEAPALRLISDSGNTIAQEIFDPPPPYENVIQSDSREEFIVTLCVDRLKALADAVSEKDKGGNYLTLSFDPKNPGAQIFVKGKIGCGIIMPAKDLPGDSPMVEVCGK